MAICLEKSICHLFNHVSKNLYRSWTKTRFLRCLYLADTYRELLHQQLQTSYECEDGLARKTEMFNNIKNALDSQLTRIRVRPPPTVATPSAEQMRTTRNRLLDVLQNMTFSSPVNKMSTPTLTTVSSMIVVNSTTNTKNKSATLEIPLTTISINRTTHQERSTKTTSTSAEHFKRTHNRKK